ncbi:insoluble domain protein [Rhodococcus marinonascens]|uniref:insoluble domain protein n=1 Tax=Rhodococcus marinonascens TaxID=38311 RepID=UPI00093385E7|nr:insoluble domain protein [Rhodococcus marinonascens]
MGKHRKQAKAIRAAGTTAVTAAVIVAACGGVASAAPAQDGVTTPAPPSQGGVTTPEPLPTWVPVPVEYQQEAKPLTGWNYDSNEYVAPDTDSYVAPIDYSRLHLPTRLEEFTAPIQAPEDKIRIGRYVADRPNWVSEDTAARTNGQTAVVEAQVTDFWRSTGLDADEAQRLSAAQLGGGAAGAVAAATAAGVPSAIVGGLVGGTIGGTSAVGLAGPVLTPLGVIPAGVVGTAAGAGIGAAVAGIPAAVGGALAGGAAGVVTATVYGTGDLGEPLEAVIPGIDQAAITAQTEATLDQWEANPVGAAAATAVRDMVASAPVAAQQVRDAVSSLPGGEGAVAAFDQAVTDFQANTAVPGLPLGMVADAIGAGIQA